ncbi:unnamed protein product [Polarella glacialis]|uniref:ATP-dependent DNA helicase n=1 Tax=Polarella glacialis TaxID=89957 RepID=A0A813FDE8_POLGL|nr:unnamed protein product [Polarella glacialis]
MSSALVKAQTLRLLDNAGGSLPAEELMKELGQRFPVMPEEIQDTVLGLLHREVILLEDGRYSSGPAAGRRRAWVLPAPELPASSQQDPPLKRQRQSENEDCCLLETERLLQGLNEQTASQSHRNNNNNNNEAEKATQSSPSWLRQAAQLSVEQQQVLQSVLDGNNVFFTGLPGTGKSFTTCVIIEALRQRLKEGELAVCASTGAAACHIGGGTLHSFLGCGLGKRQEDFDNMMRSQSRLRAAKTLVLDEISMISGEFLERASEGLAQARSRPGVAFGGLQAVLCGDFLQLPPVSQDPMLQRAGAKRFAFQAKCWTTLELRCFELTQNFRQAEDEVFQETLRRVRVGKLTDVDRSMLLNARNGKSVSPEEQSVQQRRASALRTTLYCRNVDVERENQERLLGLPGIVVEIKTEDSFNVQKGRDRSALERILEKCMAPPLVKLKVGARVMLLKNLRLPSQCRDKGDFPMVNGSVGEVVTIDKMANGEVGISFKSSTLVPIVPDYLPRAID